MFNISVKGNVRCNGIAQGGRGGMVRRNVHINNNAMPPEGGVGHLAAAADSKLKFSERLKVYLDGGGERAGSGPEHLQDPYQFSEAEAEVDKCASADNRLKTDSSVSKNSSKVYMVNGGGASVGARAEGGNAGSHGKTMSRLQAQIARNKVNVKHSRASPDPALGATARDTKRSIIGLVQNREPESRRESSSIAVRKLQAPSGKPLPAALRARRASSRSTHHEGSLQRIRARPPPDSVWHAPTTTCADEAGSERPNGVVSPVYQRHWFCRELELLSGVEGPREARLELTRTELKRHLVQMTGSRVGRWRSHESGLAMVSAARSSGAGRAPGGAPATVVGPAGRLCSGESCDRPALPCTSHCPMHIMNNAEQVLFDYCTAKFADNTQCSVPVFDITHELPLCTEHARKRDNYNRMCLETKPKKARRKIKPSAMIRPQKRNKKRKRASSSKSSESAHVPTPRAPFTEVSSEPVELNVCETSSAYESSEDVGLGTLSESEFVTVKEETNHHHNMEHVVEHVLSMSDDVVGDLELVTVEQALVTQASHLLEETDFTTVLNQIPADEFNDIFAVDRNGEYEPSREETEELERALEAVDEDVKSLEKLSQTQGLLDSLLDEHTLAESLVQIPDVFQNGYVDGGAQHSRSALPPFHAVLHGAEQTQTHVP